MAGIQYRDLRAVGFASIISAHHFAGSFLPLLLSSHKPEKIISIDIIPENPYPSASWRYHPIDKHHGYIANIKIVFANK